MILLGSRHWRKPTTAKSVYTHKVTQWTSLFFMINIAFSFASFFSHTYYPIFFPSPIFILCHSDGVKALALEVCGGSWCLTRGVFFAPRETNMQAHTVTLWTRGLCNFYHSMLFFSSSPQSIPCPVPLPNIGRKCSLKASSPTTESQRSQSATKILPHIMIPIPSLPCGCGCSWFMSASLQIPIL